MTFTTEQFNEIVGIDDSYKAPGAMMKIVLNKTEREKIFREFLDIEKDLSYDWFQEYYEQEQAQRKDKKQDFTPMSIASLLSELVSEDNPHTFTDTTAGNGGMLIKSWRANTNVFSSNPSEYWFVAHELSDRSIPFLIFNFAIRGWNGLIYHGDSLEQMYKNVFFIQNQDDNWLGFSDVNVLPRKNIDEDVMKELGISGFYDKEIKLVESELKIIWDSDTGLEGQVSLFE